MYNPHVDVLSENAGFHVESSRGPYAMGSSLIDSLSLLTVSSSTAFPQGRRVARPQKNVVMVASNVNQQRPIHRINDLSGSSFPRSGYIVAYLGACQRRGAIFFDPSSNGHSSLVECGL
jgi:hypothetical protein